MAGFWGFGKGVVRRDRRHDMDEGVSPPDGRFVFFWVFARSTGQETVWWNRKLRAALGA
jgi:hypothetical protein